MVDTFRQSIRGLRRAPGLGIAAILCIGLGAAATTTVATLVSAALIRPVPFPDGDRLARIWFDEPGVNPRIALSIPEIDEFSRIRAFDAFAGVARMRAVLAFDGGTQRVRGEAVSRGYFELLGLRASLGRLLVPGDHASDASPVVVLSHGTWMRQFGGDPGALGRAVRTERASYTIVGVTQVGFEGTVEDDVVELFVPLERYEPRSLLTDRSSRPSWVLGRLRPGATIADAQAEAAGLHRELMAAFPETYRRWGVRVEPFGESWRSALRGGGTLLFAASAGLMMIAAMNVGCLLVARVLDRRRELAVRAALGAGGRRLAAQLLTEALILVAAGGALGAFAGPWLLEAFLAIAPPGRFTLPRYIQLEGSVTTLVLSAAFLAIAGLLAGVLPAAVARRVQPGDVLREAGRSTAGRGLEGRLGAVLVAGETALTLVLLVAGGLLIRSYDRLSTLDVGFDRSRIARLAVTVSPSDMRDNNRFPALYERLQRELATVPGVDRIGLVNPTMPPFDPYHSRIELEGVQLPHAPEGLEVGAHLADEGLLPMLGVPILAGRNISRSDAPDGARVMVISRSLAALVGGPEQALGRTITVRRGETISGGAFRVVGVADNVAWDGLAEDDTRRFVRHGDGGDPRAARFDIYAPLAQFPTSLVSIGAWTNADPKATIEPIRRKLAEILPASAVHWTGGLDEEVALEYAPTRFYTLLVAAFSASALALTGIGLFALLSHAAARRSSEMGLRLALGATALSTSTLLLRGALTPIAIGVAIGVVAAFAAARAMGTFIYGIGPFDAVSFAGSVAGLIAAALVAGLIPARRVARVDPLRSLRGETT
jgi:predicted permease